MWMLREPLLDGAGSRCDGHRPLAARIAPLSHRSYLAGPLGLLARSRGVIGAARSGRGAPTCPSSTPPWQVSVALTALSALSALPALSALSAFSALSAPVY